MGQIKHLILAGVMLFSSTIWAYQVNFLKNDMKEVVKINLEKKYYSIKEGMTTERGRIRPCHNNLMASFLNMQIKNHYCPRNQMLGFLEVSFAQKKPAIFQRMSWCGSASMSLNSLVAAFNRCSGSEKRFQVPNRDAVRLQN